MPAHRQTQHAGFARGGRKSLARRFRRAIHVADATPIQPVAHGIDWARRRRRKAAAKCHRRLALRSFRPRCAIVETAGEHANGRAPALCAGLREGDIALRDKAYLNFDYLGDLTARGVFGVTRAKDHLGVKMQQRLPRPADPRILQDELVVLAVSRTAKSYPAVLRRVTALVELAGPKSVMVFRANNLTRSPVTGCAL